jgi:hypothetical protein
MQCLICYVNSVPACVRLGMAVDLNKFRSIGASVICLLVLAALAPAHADASSTEVPTRLDGAEVPGTDALTPALDMGRAYSSSRAYMRSRYSWVSAPMHHMTRRQGLRLFI